MTTHILAPPRPPTVHQSVLEAAGRSENESRPGRLFGSILCVQWCSVIVGGCSDCGTCPLMWPERRTPRLWRKLCDQQSVTRTGRTSVGDTVEDSYACRPSHPVLPMPSPARFVHEDVTKDMW